MLRFFARWRERRILARYPIAESDWREALAHCAPARRLGATDQAQLRVLATFLLRDKTLQPVQGLQLTDTMRVRVAVHTCLPILKLGLRWYRGWDEIVLYPDLFVPVRTHVDSAGVVHHSHDVLQGEAWDQGPVVLSWAAIAEAGYPAGHNVVIHEMAHKLDMLNGACNGFPPLHRRMRRQAWTRAFASAYSRLQRLQRDGDPLPLDPYGLENPGEFFAVASEMFFEAPRRLRDFSPDLYAQLALFYRQQPLPG